MTFARSAPPQFSPSFLRTLPQLEHHVQETVARHTAFGAARAMPNRGKRGHDGVGGP